MRRTLALTATLLAALAVTPAAQAKATGFYVDPNSNPAVWVNGHAHDGRAAAIKQAIATKPIARWFGNWSGDIRTAVSNYVTAADRAGKVPILVTCANDVNTALPGPALPFVVDTSRNGKGHNGEWCNPAGRKLGTPPQAGGGAEMLLWVKVPGDSDGNCGTTPGTPAGTFDPELAYRLVFGY